MCPFREADVPVFTPEMRAFNTPEMRAFNTVPENTKEATKFGLAVFEGNG